MQQGPGRWQRWRERYGIAVRIVLTAVCCVVLCVSAYQLGKYVLDAVRARDASQELQELYHAYVSEMPLPTPVGTPPAATQAAQATDTTQAAQTTDTPQPVAPAPTKLPWLSTYPDNPYHIKNAAIQKLQKQNGDIIGWLSIDGVLDEAVVQRDNKYYLARDYKGYHNANGALFLDESCDLSQRPAMYMIYGHNMKTEAMFGCLHKWEKTSWYHDHPLIHLTSLYEEGDYVIFCVGSLSTRNLSEALRVYQGKNETARYQAFIDALERASLYMKQIDVTTDDQMLVLVTCTGDDIERRVLAARKLREGETPEDAAKLARQSWRK